jgi:Ca2+-binding RTX toxin-like protein
MAGGLGNDTYTVDQAGDKVIERPTAATTWCWWPSPRPTPSSWRQRRTRHHHGGGHVAVNLTGNALDNWLTGNGAANTLIGGAGNDTLDGGAGADKLIGGPATTSTWSTTPATWSPSWPARA